MKYSIAASSRSGQAASVHIKEADLHFGITAASTDQIANPAELFLGSLSACILKSVERFSGILDFEYEKAEITVKAVRLEKPPRMDEIHYALKVYSNDQTLNTALLKTNLEKFGTIFNTVKASCIVTGEVVRVEI